MEHTINSDYGIKEHKSRLNVWLVSSTILGIIAIILLFVLFIGVSGIVGKSIDSNAAGQKVIEFAKAQGTDAKLVRVDKKDSLFEVVLSMQGKEVPVYVTLDGKNLATGLIPLTNQPVMGNNAANTNTNTNTNTPKDAPKADKPIVEAFVFSYCPYGLQFEKALFPVYDLLKNKADINIVYIGAMHGEFEHVESLRQISILKLYDKDKLFAYLKEFDTNTNIGSCSGDATCLDKYLPAIYTKLGIDKAKIEAYMANSAEKIYQDDQARASQLGIGGSPTFVINGVQVQVNRSPDAIEKAVCNAFTTSPSECSETLSTTAASPGFG